jgi:hypothetical protein
MICLFIHSLEAFINNILNLNFSKKDYLLNSDNHEVIIPAFETNKEVF